MLALLPLLAACGGAAEAPEDTATPGTCDNAEQKATYVISVLEFTAAEKDGSAWGFNLDGLVSKSDDPTGCGKADLVDPEGHEGIDNAFVSLMPLIENTEAAAIRGLLQDAVDAGELLLLIEISGLDDLENDDCVTVAVSPAIGTPMQGTDGRMLDSQSFGRDPDAPPAVVSGASVVNGRLVAQGFPLTLSLEILDAELALEIPEGAIQVDLAADGTGATGHLGGGFSIDYVMEIVDGNGVDDTLTELLRSLLPAVADLDGEAGTCKYLSVDLEYEAIPAFFYGE